MERLNATVDSLRWPLDDARMSTTARCWIGAALVLAVPAAACAPHMTEAMRRDRVMGRAPFDLECPADEIELVALDEVTREEGRERRTYGAAGCRNHATYRLYNCGNGFFASSCSIEIESGTH